jgi:hypothetical protein
VSKNEISSSQTPWVCVVNTALVGGIVVLNGATRRLASLFFDSWGVRAVSLLCPGLSTVRINRLLNERVTRANYKPF